MWSVVHFMSILWMCIIENTHTHTHNISYSLLCIEKLCQSQEVSCSSLRLLHTCVAISRGTLTSMKSRILGELKKIFHWWPEQGSSQEIVYIVLVVKQWSSGFLCFFLIWYYFFKWTKIFPFPPPWLPLPGGWGEGDEHKKNKTFVTSKRSQAKHILQRPCLKNRCLHWTPLVSSALFELGCMCQPCWRSAWSWYESEFLSFLKLFIFTVLLLCKLFWFFLFPLVSFMHFFPSFSETVTPLIFTSQ